MILLVGPSASGKTEIAKCLAKKYGIQKVITHTTRAPRLGEVNGVDYFFVSLERFLAKKDRGEFVETTFYNGRYYGTGKDQIADNKVLVVDPNGLKSYLNLEDPHIVTFLLLCSKKTREERMLSRGDDPINVEERLRNDEEAFAANRIERTDFVIDTENRSVEALADIIYQDYVDALKKR